MLYRVQKYAGLTPFSICFCMMSFQICSLSTIMREYVAMWSISSLPFKDLILSAVDVDDTSGERAWKISRPLKEFIESNHNKSQIEAIYVSSEATHTQVLKPLPSSISSCFQYNPGVITFKVSFA